MRAALGGAFIATGSFGLLPDLLVAPLLAEVVTGQKMTEVKAESGQHAGNPSHEVVDKREA